MDDGILAHQLLHVSEIGLLLISIAIASAALKRPKFTIEGIVKKLNDLQLKR